MLIWKKSCIFLKFLFSIYAWPCRLGATIVVGCITPKLRRHTRNEKSKSRSSRIVIDWSGRRIPHITNCVTSANQHLQIFLLQSVSHLTVPLGNRIALLPWSVISQAHLFRNSCVNGSSSTGQTVYWTRSSVVCVPHWWRSISLYFVSSSSCDILVVLLSWLFKLTFAILCSLKKLFPTVFKLFINTLGCWPGYHVSIWRFWNRWLTSNLWFVFNFSLLEVIVI